MFISRNFFIAALIALSIAGCSGGECAPCSNDTGCDEGLTCAEFENSFGSSDRLCAYPDTWECTTYDSY